MSARMVLSSSATAAMIMPRTECPLEYFTTHGSKHEQENSCLKDHQDSM